MNAEPNPGGASASLPEGVPPLSQLYFYLTEGCNLACRHCWLAPKYDRDGTRLPTLPVDGFEHVIREAKPLGLQRVKLTGGEPLLHPRFTDLLDIARRENIRVAIETNGLLCTEAIAARIAELNHPFVAVSLDGVDARTHETIRGIRGSFDKTCGAIRYLSGQGVRPQVIMTLMRENARQAEGMIELAEKLGASSLKFNLLQPTARGNDLHRSGDALSVAELIELGTAVDRRLSRMTKLSLHFDYPMAFQPLSRVFKGNGACGIFSILGVLSGGSYALCGIGMHVPELVFGKAGSDSLREIWCGNPVLKEIRNGLPERLGGICGDCLMKFRCLGACLAQNYYRSSSLWAPFWFCEMAAEEKRFPGTRRISSVTRSVQDREVGQRDEKTSER